MFVIAYKYEGDNKIKHIFLLNVYEWNVNKYIPFKIKYTVAYLDHRPLYEQDVNK